MADVFISYSRRDRPWVTELAAALAKRGWSVWWDRDIGVGRTFHDEIAKQLGSARCVVVVWSSDSVSSSWVLNEATEGQRRGVLVPIMLNAKEAPLAFRDLQAADLSDWRPDNPHAEFDRLLKSVAEAAPLTVGGKILAQLHRDSIELDRIDNELHAVLPMILEAIGPPLVPSPALSAIVGPSPIARRLAAGKVLDFIRSNPPNERNQGPFIIRGAALRGLFGEKQTVTISDVIKVVSDNLS